MHNLLRIQIIAVLAQLSSNAIFVYIFQLVFAISKNFITEFYLMDESLQKRLIENVADKEASQNDLNRFNVVVVLV